MIKNKNLYVCFNDDENGMYEVCITSDKSSLPKYDAYAQIDKEEMEKTIVNSVWGSFYIMDVNLDERTCKVLYLGDELNQPQIETEQLDEIANLFYLADDGDARLVELRDVCHFSEKIGSAHGATYAECVYDALNKISEENPSEEIRAELKFVKKLTEA